MFSKMTLTDDGYFINKKQPFKKIGTFKKTTIERVFDFSYRMSFSGEGEHRDHRTGGSYARKNAEIFANTFQGKLAECAFYNLLYKLKIESTEPDFSVHKLGIWDAEDFNVNGKSISIKSTKSFGNLLLLEEKDWDNKGVYLPSQKKYDCTFLIRMNPYCEEILKQKRLLYSDNINSDVLSSLITNQIWEYDIPGYITNEDLVHIINNKNIIPRGAKLNLYTTMDASNYYVQAGEMTPIDDFIKSLI